MAARGSKTTLAFGFVSCPVSLYKTTEAEKAPTWETAGPNGGKLSKPGEPKIAPVEEQKDEPLADGKKDAAEAFADIVQAESTPEADYLIEDKTGKRVERGDVRKGIRRNDGSFVDLTDGLRSIEERTKLEEMRVADFIRVEEIRRERVTGSYYLAPDGPEAPKVIRLLFEAMRETKRVAVVKWTKKSKQSLGVLVPHPQTSSLLLVEMSWTEDVREPPEKVYAPAQAQVTPGEVAVAVELVRALSGTRAQSLDVQTDDARAMRRELIERAEAGEMFELPARPGPMPQADVIDIMRASIADPDALAASAA